MSFAVNIRTMSIDDMPLGMRLKKQAGWNQTHGDWQRFLKLSPQGCFVAVGEGREVGCVATFVFGNVGWIAMLLVDNQVKGNGVGTALMNHALAHLAQAGVRSVRLDATPQGKPVYDKLGFAVQFEIVRYAGTLATNAADIAEPGCDVRTISHKDWDEVFALDQAVVKTDRKALLTALLEEEHAVAFVAREDGHVTGYCLGRRGGSAAYIGPCVAITSSAGRSLLVETGQYYAGQRVMIDVPVENKLATAWATRHLSVQRPLTRMCKGLAVQEVVEHVWASSGPEKG